MQPSEGFFFLEDFLIYIISVLWKMAKLKQEMLLQLVITTDFCVKRDLVNSQKVNEMWYVWDTAENRKKFA